MKGDLSIPDGYNQYMTNKKLKYCVPSLNSLQANPRTACSEGSGNVGPPALAYCGTGGAAGPTGNAGQSACQGGQAADIGYFCAFGEADNTAPDISECDTGTGFTSTSNARGTCFLGSDA